MDYIILLETIRINPMGEDDPNGTILWGGVSFKREHSTYENSYRIIYNNMSYLIDKEYAVIIDRPTRLVNESYDEYRSRKHIDKTTDYFKAVKEIKGIDMRINYSPQFRDGVNPHKDGNKNKEINNK